MTLEYILLLTVYVAVLMGVMVTAPDNAFRTSGPRLGARVEVQLATGSEFRNKVTGFKNEWKSPR